MEKQVDKSNYKFERYCLPERWSSYYYQLKLVLDLMPGSILEIGVGDGVFRDYIRSNTNIEYKSLDFAGDLSPDYVESVDDFSLGKKFDVICAFEVLEHLPFDSFERALKNIYDHSSKYVILSLPHFGPIINFSIKLPFFRKVDIFLKIPFPKKHFFNGQHYWEIGKKGYSVKIVKNILNDHFLIKNDFVPHNSPYHHFFVLEKK